MSEELSYILTTPYTLAKSRTGGVLSRLLSRLDLELIAAQIFAPSAEIVEEYAQSMLRYARKNKPGSGELLHQYVMEHMMPSSGRPHRVALFLFRGEDACHKLSDVVGALYPEHRSIESLKGETIRDTYADLVYEEGSKKVAYFEPAVLTPPTQEIANHNLSIFARATEGAANIVENMSYPKGTKVERTLVILKPDNWRFPSSRPGTILDMFARTGLRIVGCKVYQMSVNEALEFYGPVQKALEEKLGPKMGKRAVESLTSEFKTNIGDESAMHIAREFGKAFAKDQFERIVEFMSGQRPDECPLENRDDSGKVKSMIVVYEGEGAIEKIREVLGPTDPTKAPGGTVRREFGHDVMVNTAHASDSPESVEREFKVVKIQQNRMSILINSWLEQP